MSKQLKLSARTRTNSGTTAAREIRRRGGVPANIYGSRMEPLNLEVNRREIETLLSHSAGEHLLVDLQIEDNGQVRSNLTLIQEVQHHPVRGEVVHVDFHAVSANETIEAEIPVEPIGEADGVKNFGGILELILRSLTVRCLPQDLPEVIQVDVSALKVGESLHVRDLPLPTGVEAALDGDVTVVAVAEPNVVATPVETPAAPEVIKEKKAEDSK
jgi:large subunit ribosomal protein L25